MTIEKLAHIVIDGFTESKKQFRQIDNRFGKVDTTLTKLDIKIDHEVGNLATAVKTGFDHVQEQLAEVDKRLDGIDGKINHISNRIDTVVTHERRITRIEKKMGIPTVD